MADEHTVLKAKKVIGIQRLGVVSRVLSAFIFACSVLAMIAVVFALILEPFHYIAILVIPVFALMMHISGHITFNGYAPTYLLFAHGTVRVDKQ